MSAGIVSTAVVDRAAREPLASADVWCNDVLAACQKQSYSPDPHLCKMAPQINGLCETSRYDEAKGYDYHHGGAEGEEERNDAPAVSANGCGGTAATAAERVRGAEGPSLTLPPPLLAKAYRLDAPCVTAKHSAKTAATRANCEASPVCLYGLQTLRSSKKAVADCVEFCMGRGPQVLPLPASVSAAAALPPARTAKEAQILAKHANADEGTSEMGSSTNSSSVRELEGDLAPLTIPDNFPCLWRGLVNLGNTCYFNSVLQLLFATPMVRRAILAADGAVPSSSPAPPISPSAAAAAETGEAGGAGQANASAAAGQPAQEVQLLQSGLKEVFAEMAFSRHGNGASPASFARYLSIDPAVQQDAQEFLALLMDWLRCHCGPAVKASIDATFAGALLYDRRCGACGRSAKRAEPFLYLTVPVKPTLQESLADFMKPESVEGFTCEGCGRKATATSRQYLRTLPDVLVIHINRFEFDMRTLQRQKVLSATTFPLTLDMSPYEAQWTEARRQEQQQQQQQQEERNGAGEINADPTTTDTSTATAAATPPPELLYELRGVLNHLGDSAISGHYTYQGKVYHAAPPTTRKGSTADSTAATTAEEGEEERSICWLNFNDAEVSKLNRFKGVNGQSKDAYVLVYHRLPASSPAHDAAATAAAAAEAERGAPPGEAESVKPTSAKARNPPPVPREFPPYLLQYVARLNHGCLEERKAWERNKEELSVVLTKWAQAASAVFDAPSERLGGFAAAFDGPVGGKGGVEPVYAMPTAWLRLFGRGFLAPFVNVDDFGDDAGIRKKAKEEEDTKPGAGTAAGNPLDAATSPVDTALGLPGAANEDEEGGRGGDVERRSSVAGGGANAANGLLVNDDGTGYYRTVCRHNVEHFLVDIACPHGRLAPWGAYKVISKVAFSLIREYLLLCNAYSHTMDEDVTVLTAAQKLGGAGRSPTTTTASLFNLQANACPSCAAAMAASVRELSLDSRADVFALLSLHESAASGTPADVDDATREGRSGPVGVTSSSLPLSSPPPPSQQDPLVYISEEIASNWEAYMGAKSIWQSISKAAGFTGVFAMMRNNLSPPVPTAPATASPTVASPSLKELQGGGKGRLNGASAFASAAAATATAAAVAPVPHQQLLELQQLKANLLLAMREQEEAVDIAPTTTATTLDNAAADKNSGKDTREGEAAAAPRDAHHAEYASDIRSSFICEHGGLRPDSAVRVVPESVRQYLLRRIPVIMECAGALNDLPSLRIPRHPTAPVAASTSSALPSTPSPVSPLLVTLMERVALPYIVCAMTPRCTQCVSLAAHHLTARHTLKVERMKERKAFPTLSAAGKLTDADIVKAMLMASTEAESEEQLIRAQHPNRGFFKRNAEKEWRDHVKVWKENQALRLARQEAAIKELKVAADKQRESDDAWRTMTNQRSGGRGGRGGRSVSGTMAPTDPRNPIRQLALAEDYHAKMLREEPPALTTSYGCLPMWWVARWYQHVNAVNGSGSPVLADRGDLGEGRHLEEEDDLSTALARVDYGSFLCPHDGLLVEMSWLNPADGFWQGMRVKRPEALWNDAGDAVTGAKGSLGREDMRWTSWLPPLLIVPMEEFIGVLQRYGTPDMLTAAEKKAGDEATEVVATADEAKEGEEAGDSATPPVVVRCTATRGKTIQLVEHNGERVLSPRCCDICCRSLVDSFEDNCAYFTSGTLKLQLHIRKSKKLFYDTECLLDSKVLASHDAAAGDNQSGATGSREIHHFTTLQQLRVILSEYIMNDHGYLVPADARLEVLRGRRPLKRKRGLPGAGPPAAAPPAVAMGRTRESAVSVSDSADSASASREPSPASRSDARREGGGGHASLDDATLYELGIHDGDTLVVNYTDGVAAPCAKARRPGVNGVVEEEEWEAIPAELLMEGQHGHAAGEQTVAFGQTRLLSGDGAAQGASGAGAVATVAAGGAAGPHAPVGEVGVSCPVCTFLNAPGMVACEMCESPLPAPAPHLRR